LVLVEGSVRCGGAAEGVFKDEGAADRVAEGVLIRVDDSVDDSRLTAWGD